MGCAPARYRKAAYDCAASEPLLPSFRILIIIEGAGTVFHSDIELFDTDIDKEGLSYSDRASHSSIFTSSSSSISAFSLDSA